MLFSNPQVADVMNQQFECAWRKAGDVSRAKIDFADGTSMERTLGGNILTWICDADGFVQDVLPGLMDAPAYLSGLEAGHAFAIAQSEMQDPKQRMKALRARNWGQSEGWTNHIASKMKPIELVNPHQSLLTLVEPFPTTSQAVVIDAFEVSIAKSAAIEDPVIKQIGRAKPDHFDGPLEEDTWIAQNQLRPQAIALLNAQPTVTVDDLSPYLYRLVLHVDARDPYLGMQKALLGRTDAFVTSR